MEPSEGSLVPEEPESYRPFRDWQSCTEEEAKEPVRSRLFLETALRLLPTPAAAEGELVLRRVALDPEEAEALV
jgi:hypothetical protein